MYMTVRLKLPSVTIIILSEMLIKLVVVVLVVGSQQ